VLQKMLGFSVETSDLSSLADKMAANLESAPGPEAQPRRSGVYG